LTQLNNVLLHLGMPGTRHPALLLYAARDLIRAAILTGCASGLMMAQKGRKDTTEMKWTYHPATVNSLACYRAEEHFVQYMIVEAYPDTLYIYYRNTGESICIPL
jgi:hypothetical protein